ncbi:hypothetical protein RSSM_02576 [Rhodopirellula sallentina SM41]|uniref:Uncharacterized protein n=1 Tax=Rhodopirellula sallentina SM41 TaxID=1263870 RepID=M5UDP4_9BACT|nr:hypothetical protein RSSM_02576 [Rhodopirellula sallentina SM41]
MDCEMLAAHYRVRRCARTGVENRSGYSSGDRYSPWLTRYNRGVCLPADPPFEVFGSALTKGC